MRRVIIMSGASGSGKSTYARKLCGESSDKSVIVSADDYFMVKGEYRFDPSFLSAAHNACFREFILSLDMPQLMSRSDTDLVVVDNTNTTSVEIAPYMLAAQAFGYAVEIVTLDIHAVPQGKESDPTWFDARLHRLAERNSHGVGIQAIRRQCYNLAERRLMAWWKHTYISVDV